jgi:hypothetical protein
MGASFLEQMLTIYTHLGMLSNGKFPLLFIFFVTLTKVRVQLCTVKLDQRRSPE